MSVDREVRETAEELQLTVSLLVRQMRTVSVSAGVTLSQTSVLKRLDREGPMTAADLARVEKIRAQSVIATVNVLQADGYVERTAHPTDRRRRLITLTNQGREFLRGRKVAGHDRLAELMAERLTETERRTVSEAVILLRRLAED
ncbi:MarR family winged helix-turn-helix transcriptional regulator [Streptomyces erythrochromogenes]|uniref:MarR family winged helix-turn-helix transcriptional regulator n=1 Tax=Streptomyces erythrochromogenes TaxID=285574 RepID=UPI00367610C0